MDLLRKEEVTVDLGMGAVTADPGTESSERDREWDAAMVAMGVRGGNGGVGSGGRVVYEADGRACGEWRWVEDGDDIDEDEETQVTTPRDLVPALIRVMIQSHTTPEIQRAFFSGGRAGRTSCTRARQLRWTSCTRARQLH